MKVSWNWLRELVKLDDGVSAEDAAARLSSAGVAVDAVTAVGSGISGVIVAEIRGKRPHPNAAKLTLVDVFDGKEVTQVVCGAPNVPEPGAPGRSPRVAWARPGAKLPSGIELGVREVRGIPSPGMLCAEDELGLSTDHAGIILLRPEDGLEIGSDFASGVGLPDFIFELDITPNRPDLLGHVGVARELGALYAMSGARLTLPAPDLLPHLATDAAESAVEIVVEDGVACPRYLGHVLTGLTVAPSPIKLRLLLSRLGARPLSNLVDATNLALFAFGQPLHAFDLERLGGRKVVVRRARANETMTTLDGATRALGPSDLVIADAEAAMAIAGVMGGQDSEVRATTKSVFLESAYFDPITIRRTARRLKMHTEASHRFERGVDPNSGLDQATRYCLSLLCSLGGGRLLRGCVDVYSNMIRPKVVTLRPSRTTQILGTEVPAPVQAEKLNALGLAVDPQGQSTSALSVTVPTFRPDLTREIDLIEEIGRLVGYGSVAPRVPALHMAPPPADSADTRRRLNAERARDLCVSLGFNEVQLFSMTGPEKLRSVVAFADPQAAFLSPLLLENPLREELSALRTQLLPGLLEALAQNQNRGLSAVRLFEVGEVYLPRPSHDLPDERTRVAGVLCGHRPYFLKAGPGDALDFYDARGIVEELLSGLGYKLAHAPGGPAQSEGCQVILRAQQGSEAPWHHPGVGAVIVSTVNGRIVGDFGEIHPTLREQLQLEGAVYGFEIEIPSQPRRAPKYEAPSRYPAVARDLSFFIDEETPAGAICAAIQGAGEPLLHGISVLEDYREAGRVPTGKKGLLFGLVYRSDEGTLTDERVQKAHEGVLSHLQKTLPIQLR
jgi:phenylalanyl-tRNA synthetase beta chain